MLHPISVAEEEVIVVVADIAPVTVVAPAASVPVVVIELFPALIPTSHPFPMLTAVSVAARLL
jgi:hypothetical protein